MSQAARPAGSPGRISGFQAMALALLRIAGAIHPKVGFKYAFQNGADFICVGMYDFQIVDDVNLALDVFSGDLKRQRPWIV